MKLYDNKNNNDSPKETRWSFASSTGSLSSEFMEIIIVLQGF